MLKTGSPTVSRLQTIARGPTIGTGSPLDLASIPIPDDTAPSVRRLGPARGVRTGLRAIALAWGVAGAASAQNTYVPLATMGPSYGMKVTVNSKTAVELKSQWTTMRFTPESRKLLLNNTLIWLNEPIQSVKGQWCIHSTDQAKTIDPILRPSQLLRGTSASVVLLDPGHGGDDPGAVSPGKIQEKTLTLDLARQIRAKLANAGVRAILTRDSDRALSLSERTGLIRRHGAHAFVSLHFNSTSSRSIYGIETYALPPRGCSSTAGGESSSRRTGAYAGNQHDAANMALAYQIHRSMRVWLGTSHDRGIRRARFQVLREATCPAVLVECGFMSHASTESKFRSPAYLDTLAQRIADGIVAYVKAVREANAAPARSGK
jgi:N-acetylmuramoyl-L-alanine amidase